MESPNYRAVLIGIDDYPKSPLSGCVNDIDQIERILLDRLAVPAERITRFAAPRAGAASTTRLASLKPTRDELRNFLENLAGEVGPNDLVFLYYSGHGSQVRTTVNGCSIPREALVPMDYWNDGDPQHQRLLYDFELNGLLARIAEKAGDLTVVLDCCHSASVDRDDILPEGQAARYLFIPEAQDLSSEIQPGLVARDSSGLLPAAPIHMLIAACRAGEKAYEVPAEGSKPPQGAFSRALAQILESADRPLSDLLWADVWTVLLDRIAGFNSLQHPQLVGRGERRLFGGPWAPRDTGYVVRQDGNHRFRIEAGTLTGLSEDAVIAVYGSKPDLFPDLNSAADSAARIGLLRVEKADRSSCTAVLMKGDPDLPEDARGRLVRPGNPDRLIVSVEPFDPALTKKLEARNVKAVPSGNPEAEVFLRRDEKGWLRLEDKLYGDDRDPQRPALGSFPASDQVVLERVLEHWLRYVQVLRLPDRCRDLPTQALRVELLDCPDMTALTAEDLQAPDFPTLSPDAPWNGKVKEGNGFAIAIGNRVGCPLYVTVLNCAGSGRVEYLGDVEVPAGSRQVVWREGVLGSPFYPAVGAAGESIVDRLVIVGTTLPNRSLRYLESDYSFAEVINGQRDTGTRTAPNFPAEKWTAEMVTLRIYQEKADQEVQALGSRSYGSGVSDSRPSAPR